MDRTALMRATLWATVFFNIGGALNFIFPASLGQTLLGLPLPAPHFYTWFMALIIGAGAGLSAWLALQPRINRSLVAVIAMAKTGFFVVALACWFLGEVPARCVAIASVDLALAAVCFWWLLRGSRQPHGAQQGVPGDVAASRRRA
jgi:hypothetical protein